jgi:tetratricopeptide (TPR) repeat protein
MKKVLLIVFFAVVFAPGSIGAKENLDLIKGNYYYSHLAFQKAIPYYEKIVALDSNAQVYARLADCYRLTGDIAKAAVTYKKALEMPRYGEIVMLRYGQVMMELMEYEEAARWLKEYYKGNPRERRAANLIAGCLSARERLQQAPVKLPTFLPINTDRSEFAPALWNGNLVFAADTAVHLFKNSSSWTGNSCFNMYMVPCDGEGNCSEEINSLTTASNASWHDGPCTFNADGDTMYFTRTKYNDKFFLRGTVVNEDNTVLLETMIATEYDESKHSFKKVRPFRFNHQRFAVVHPTISPDGTMLVFSSTMMGSGSDLYLCVKNKKGKWLRPQNLGPAVNTEGEEVFPFFANDSTLFFASDGHKGLGGLDIYFTHLDHLKHTLSEPTNIGVPINSSYDDISMALLPDGSGGYFSSNRPAEKAGDNLYFFKK